MEDCIFCKIVSGEIKSDFIYEDDDIVAFLDISPKAPVHVLIIPKEHINAVYDLGSSQEKILGKIHLAAQKIAGQKGIRESGYRLICNNGKDAGQEVEHLHWHLLGGKNLGGLIEKS